MNKEFSPSWISSKKPNKQRKYRFNAPLHIKGKFLNAHLSKELQKKYDVRSLRVRVGDKVKIMRGQFKKQEGKVEEVSLKNTKIYIAKADHVKRDGTKARYPINPSNVMIIELNTDDKYRMESLNKSPNTKSNNAEKKAVDKKSVDKKVDAAPKAKPVKENKSAVKNG